MANYFASSFKELLIYLYYTPLIGFVKDSLWFNTLESPNRV